MSETRTVTALTATNAIQKCFAKKRPVFLWGPPGIGKSEIVESIIAKMGGLMIDLRLGQMDPTDIRGIPFYNKEKGVMDWAPPVELPSEELASQFPIVAVFFDEMNSSAPAVQAASYQLILNRRIGQYKLPDNVVMIAAGNRESDKGVTYRMPTPLANRFVHLEMRPDFNCWLDWAVQNNEHKDVVGYLQFAKQDLYDFDPKSSSRSFATPRTWSFVSELIEDDDGTDPSGLTDLIAGTIGEGLAIKFMAHRKFAGDLPNPEDILDGSVKELKVKEISAMYSLVVSLCYELKASLEDDSVNDKKWHEYVDNFFAYMMDNFETEIVVMGARIALTTYELPMQPTKLKNFDRLYEKYGKYIVKSNQAA
jgi:hypothetical protein